MSKLILNPNSIFANSQANFIVTRDAVYTFTRAVSSLNSSIYGIQPTKEQLMSGITLDDLEPLSANHSLCADVYFLNNNVDALKFFAQRPFVPCTSIENRDQIATNPLAIYLTPLPRYNPVTGRSLSKRKLMNNLKALEIWDQVKTFLESEGYQDDWDTSTTLDENDPMLQTAITALKASFGLSDAQVESLIANSVADGSADISANDSYEWAFVFKNNVSWEDIKEYSDGKHYLSTAVADGKAKWELIGSTSLTDEKISSLVGGFEEKINALSDAIDEVSENLTNKTNALSTAIKNEETARKNADIALDDKIDSEIENRQAADIAEKERALAAETELGNAIDELEDKIEENVSALSTAIDTVSDNLDSTADSLSGAINGLSNIIEVLSGGSELEISALELSVSQISTAFDNYVAYNNDAMGTIISSTLPNLSNDLTEVIDAVSTDLSNAMSVFVLSSDYNAFVGAVGVSANNLCVEISSMQEDVSFFYDTVNELSANLSSLSNDTLSAIDNILTSALPTLSNDLTSTISAVSSNLCIELSSTNESLAGFIDLMTDELSTNINPKLSTISECVSAEVQRVDEISAKLSSLSDELTNIFTLSDYVKKSDLCAAILPNVYEYNHYVSGDIPESISVIVEWNRAIHTALLSCCEIVIQ